MTEQDHATGVGDAQDVDTQAVGDDGAAEVVDRHLHNLLACPHLPHQLVDSYLAAFLRCVGHWPLPIVIVFAANGFLCS